MSGFSCHHDKFIAEVMGFTAEELMKYTTPCKICTSKSDTCWQSDSDFDCVSSLSDDQEVFSGDQKVSSGVRNQKNPFGEIEDDDEHHSAFFQDSSENPSDSIVSTRQEFVRRFFHDHKTIISSKKEQHDKNVARKNAGKSKFRQPCPAKRATKGMRRDRGDTINHGLTVC